MKSKSGREISEEEIIKVCAEIHKIFDKYDLSIGQSCGVIFSVLRQVYSIEMMRFQKSMYQERLRENFDIMVTQVKRDLFGEQ